MIELSFFSVIKKEPQIIQEDNLKSALGLQELNIDIEGEECRELSRKMKKFYFGEIEECAMPKTTIFMVIETVHAILLFIQ